MLIYRYLKSHALETIRDGLLKVSRLSEFNDPFEGMFGMPESFSAKEAKAYVEKAIKQPSIECSPRFVRFKTQPGLDDSGIRHGLSKKETRYFAGLEQRKR